MSQAQKNSVFEAHSPSGPINTFFRAEMPAQTMHTIADEHDLAWREVILNERLLNNYYQWVNNVTRKELRPVPAHETVERDRG